MSAQGPYRTQAETLPEDPRPPEPPPRPVISPERAAWAIAVMQARHPWLAAAGIRLIVDYNAGGISARWKHQEQPIWMSGCYSLGDLDAWFAGLWDALYVSSEPLAQ